MVHYISFLTKKFLLQNISSSKFSLLEFWEFFPFPFHDVMFSFTGLKTDCSDCKTTLPPSRFNQRYDNYHIWTKSRWLKNYFVITTINLQFNLPHKKTSITTKNNWAALFLEYSKILKTFFFLYLCLLLLNLNFLFCSNTISFLCIFLDSKASVTFILSTQCIQLTPS